MSSRRAPPQRSERGLDARCLLRRQAARSDRVDQLLDGRLFHGRPLRRCAALDASTAPAWPVDLGLLRGDRLGREVRAQGIERLLGVDVGAVLGQDRQHQLAGRVVHALPDRHSVHGAHRRARVIDQAGSIASQPACPRQRRVGGLWLATKDDARAPGWSRRSLLRRHRVLSHGRWTRAALPARRHAPTEPRRRPSGPPR